MIKLGKADPGSASSNSPVKCRVAKRDDTETMSKAMEYIRTKLISNLPGKEAKWFNTGCGHGGDFSIRMARESETSFRVWYPSRYFRKDGKNRSSGQCFCYPAKFIEACASNQGLEYLNRDGTAEFSELPPWILNKDPAPKVLVEGPNIFNTKSIVNNAAKTRVTTEDSADEKSSNSMAKHATKGLGGTGLY